MAAAKGSQRSAGPHGRRRWYRASRRAPAAAAARAAVRVYHPGVTAAGRAHRLPPSHPRWHLRCHEGDLRGAGGGSVHDRLRARRGGFPLRRDLPRHRAQRRPRHRPAHGEQHRAVAQKQALSAGSSRGWARTPACGRRTCSSISSRCPANWSFGHGIAQYVRRADAVREIHAPANARDRSVAGAREAAIEAQRVPRGGLDPKDALAAHLMGLAVGCALILGLTLSVAIVLRPIV